MKFKKLLGGGLLATVLALGVGAGLAVRGESKEAKADNNGRFSILINDGSGWKDAYAHIFATYSSAGEIRITPDADLGIVENDGFTWQDIGGTWYAVLTMEVDTSTFTYDKFYFQRKNPAETEIWNTYGWDLSPAKVKDGVSNTVVINADSSFTQDWGNYWKISTYSGVVSYSDLSKAEKHAYLKSAGYEFVPGTPSAPAGYVFAGWYEDTSFTTPWTSASRATSDVKLFAKYVEVTAQFVLKNGSLGEILNYNGSNDQFEGVIESGANFKVRKTIDSTYTDYAVLESGMSEHTDIAVVEDGYVVVKAAHPVMVYFKNDTNEMWITAASGELIAYAYAGYFLTYVGCDNSGINLPSGWTDVKNRYESSAVTNDAKDFIYEFDVSTAKAGDDIAAMIVRYNLACTNHPTLDRFIKDSGGHERPINKVSTNPISILGSMDNSTPIMLVVIISVVSLTAVGGYIFLKRRKEN